MEKVTKAIQFAAAAHDGMIRKKDKTPYILHPLEASVIVGSMTDDEDIICAALLHDVVEDTDITIEAIEENFGPRVRALVESETEDKRADLPPEDTWKIRKEESLEDLAACGDVAVQILWLGDKLSNMRAISRDYAQLGDALWQRVNQKEKAQHGWYYSGIAQCLAPLAGSAAYAEYTALVQKVFG